MRAVSTCWVLIACLGASEARAFAERLTLSDAIATARRNHPDVRVAMANEAVAKANAGLALSAWLPNLSFSAFIRGDEAQFTPTVAGTASGSTMTGTGPAQFDGTWTYLGALTLSQLVFDGGRTLSQIAAARALVAQSAQDRATQQLAVEASVTAAYFAALEADAQLFVADQFEKQQKSQVTIIRKLITAGIRKEMDGLAAEARARRASYDRVRAAGTIGVRRAALIAAMGVEQDNGFSLVDTMASAPTEETSPVDDLVSRAWTLRPEIRSLEAAQRVATQQVRAARSDYFPSMSLGLTAAFNGSSDLVAAANAGMGGSKAPQFDLYGTLTLQEQVFTGLSTYRAAQAARAQLEVVRARLASIRAQIRGAVASAYKSVMAARDAEKEAVALVERTDKLVASAQKQYDAGYLSMLELYDAQSQSVTALGLRVSAHYAVALARTDLRRAMGGTILEGDVLK